jgi:hypothetical protein
MNSRLLKSPHRVNATDSMAWPEPKSWSFKVMFDGGRVKKLSTRCQQRKWGRVGRPRGRMGSSFSVQSSG